MADSVSLYTRLVAHARSHLAPVIGFLWGLAEATAFFIVPDVYLGFLALFHWRRSLVVMLSALLGALAGGALMYILGMHYPLEVDRFLARIPLIDPAMVQRVEDQMQAGGLAPMFKGPFTGTPYKVYAAQAGEGSLPFLQFLLATIPARGERFLPVVLAFGAAGSWFRQLVERHTKKVVVVYILLWGLIYLVLILSLRLT